MEIEPEPKGMNLLRYPRQFQILLGGEFVSIVGRSMIFPFLTLYLHGRLGLPLTTVGMLLAVFSLAGAAGQVLGGLLADRLGRKWVMAVSLLTTGVLTLALAFVATLAQAAQNAAAVSRGVVTGTCGCSSR